MFSRGVETTNQMIFDIYVIYALVMTYRVIVIVRYGKWPSRKLVSFPLTNCDVP